MRYSNNSNIPTIQIDTNSIRYKSGNIDEVILEEDTSYDLDIPIVVRKKEDHYEVIDGKHRLKKARDEGRDTMLAKIWYK